MENSNYSDCKSAIKAIEFISQRIPTVASDIAPYRRFAGLHGISDFQVVPNTFEGLEAGGRDGDSADRRRGTPEGIGATTCHESRPVLT